METNQNKQIDPQEVITKLKKLIELLKTKPTSRKNGDELKTSHTPQN